MVNYNSHRSHQEKICSDKTSIETLEDGENNLVQIKSDGHLVKKRRTVR